MLIGLHSNHSVAIHLLVWSGYALLDFTGGDLSEGLDQHHRGGHVGAHSPGL
jgi:hypothetical protein